MLSWRLLQDSGSRVEFTADVQCKLGFGVGGGGGVWKK